MFDWNLLLLLNRCEFVLQLQSNEMAKQRYKFVVLSHELTYLSNTIQNEKDAPQKTKSPVCWSSRVAQWVR